MYFAKLGIAAVLALGAGTMAGAQETPAPCCATSAPAAVQQAPAASAASERFAGRVESLLLKAPVDKGEWGLLVVDATTGATLYQRNAEKYFLPASNMKLLTTALALDRLGTEFRFRTTVETDGQISARGRLTGNLILVGRGDPNLSNRKFPFEKKEEFDGGPEKVIAELADKIVAKGVKAIYGDIVGDDSYFPRERYPDGWEIDDIVWEYGAAISALVVDDNTVSLTLTPGARAGSRVAAVVEPVTPDFTVKNEVVTSAAREKPELRLTREPGANVVVVTGTMPAGGAPRKLVLAIQEPAQHAAAMLARLLMERGVKIRGKIRAAHEPDPAEAKRTVLAEHLSVPLGESVKLVNKISQNLHTEVLLRTTARQQGVWATPEDLPKFATEFYERAGIAPDDVVQTDGSGLSRHDLVTPRALVLLLQYAAKQPWFPEYFASLPVAGEDGTLSDRLKGSEIVRRIHAKTGSVTHVRSLSGYADTPGGRRLIFSMLTNNQQGKNHDLHDAMDEVCRAMIEEFDGPAAMETKPQ